VSNDLKPYLELARWFGGKGRPFTVGEPQRLGSLPGEDADLQVVVDLVPVSYDDAEGGVELYQLPLALYRDPQPQLDHAFVGWWDDEDGDSVHAYDAAHDRAAMDRYLSAFLAAGSETGMGETGGAAHGTLRFRRVPGHELEADVRSTLFTGQQSNSSVAFGEDSLMKLFRKVTPGENPDITLHETLTRAGSEHIAALYGWVEVDRPDGIMHLAMLQQFLRTASDGWELAQASVRNLYAEADLHADEVGGDFAGESARLGEAVAEVHATLLAELGGDTLPASDVAEQMAARLDVALSAVPELAAQEQTLRGTFARLADLGRLDVQRIHGDLHLGQTLRTVRGWKLVDFEGEPAKTLAERVRPDSPWRDVAGMLRSFDYAARVVERTMGSDSPASHDQLAFRAGEWGDRNRDAFLTAYAGRALTEQEEILLTAYVADKAVYEAVYEARNRPTWVSIPLDALARWRQTRPEPGPSADLPGGSQS
jgi:maltokinase